MTDYLAALGVVLPFICIVQRVAILRERKRTADALDLARRIQLKLDPLESARLGRFYGRSADGRMLSIGRDGNLRTVGTHPYPTDHVTEPEPSYAGCVTVSHRELEGRIDRGDIVVLGPDGLYRKG